MVSTFLLLAFAVLLRSVLNLVIYAEELKFEADDSRPNDAEKDFTNWFKRTHPAANAAIEILYLVVLGIRNASIIINLARWAVIEEGLKGMAMDSLEDIEHTMYSNPQWNTSEEISQD